MAAGFLLGGVHFEVHRYHPPLIYGRIANEEKNEGISLTKGKGKEGGDVFLLITYELPILSPRAIEQQIKFYNEHGWIISG